MNLIKDNYKYLTKDISDMSGNHKSRKKRRLMAMIRTNFEKFYVNSDLISSFKQHLIDKNNFKNIICIDLYNKYKVKDLSTRTFIRELINTKDEANIIMAHEIIKSENK